MVILNQKELDQKVLNLMQSKIFEGSMKGSTKGSTKAFTEGSDDYRSKAERSMGISD